MKLRDSAERRLITILHCDLVNSTGMVERLDAEDVMSVVETFLKTTSDIVDQYHGSVAGFTGDGFEAYFGYPVTTEAPAADAIRAALHIRDALLTNQMELPIRLHCRIGVSTGLAVVAKPTRDNFGRHLFAFGSVAHLAERLQSVAQSDQVFVDYETRKLASKYFVYGDVGRSQLKGFESDVEISEVISTKTPRARFDFTERYDVPITGRGHIIDLLTDRWSVVEEGEGQVVFLTGEAGMGKSRSVYEFENRIANTQLRTFRYQCSSQHTSSALHPWLHNLESLANFRQADSPEQRTQKCKTYLSEELRFPDHLVELCLSLLGLSESEQAVALSAPPSAVLTELQSYLLEMLFEQARKSPVLIIFEDVQWIDATTKASLESLIESAPGESVFVCITSRPTEHTFGNSSHVTQLSLVKLSQVEVRQLIDQRVKLFGGHLTDLQIDQIVSRCDGNPLYIEELTTMFLDSSPETNNALANQRVQVPSTLQMSLLSRLDRINKGRELAQIAAVIGMPFDVHQIQTIAKLDATDALEGLETLVESNILRSIRKRDRILYEFRHSLLQDAVYESLLKANREGIHGSIGFYLQDSANVGDVVHAPELLANHFELAGDFGNAFDYWVLAGEKALRTGASSEAIHLLEKANSHLSFVADNAHYLASLQRMHMARGLAIMAVQGAVGNPSEQFKLASEASEKMGDLELTVEALDWQFGVAYNSGQLDLCQQPAQRLAELGVQHNSSIADMAGSQALGLLYFNQGRFQEAVDMFDALLDRESELVSGQHCYPSLSLSYFAWSKCILGEREEAAALAERSIRSSQLESPHAFTIALSNCSYVFHCLNDHTRLSQCNEDLVEHCALTGEYMYSLRARIMHDYLMTKRSMSDDYIPSMLENLNALVDAQEEVEITYLFGLLANVQILLGQYDDARQSLKRAIHISEKNGEMFYYAELNRMMVIVSQADPDSEKNTSNVNYFERSLLVAREQGAVEWEKMTLKLSGVRQVS